MGDWGGAPGMQPGTQHLLLAEILGLAMARRAADILDRHRAALMGAPAGSTGEAGSGEAGSGQHVAGRDRARPLSSTVSVTRCPVCATSTRTWPSGPA